jgi:DNA-binding MarR family transcriptional regulator
MSTPSPSSRETAARELMFVTGYVHRLLHRAARMLRLRWTALMVLKDLQVLGPSSQRVLAEIEQVSAPTMTVLLGEMEHRRWIRRKEGNEDARVSLVTITATGRKELQRSGRLLRERLEKDLAGLPPAAINQMRRGLAAYSAAIHKSVRMRNADPSRQS